MPQVALTGAGRLLHDAAYRPLLSRVSAESDFLEGTPCVSAARSLP